MNQPAAPLNYDNPNTPQGYGQPHSPASTCAESLAAQSVDE